MPSNSPAAGALARAWSDRFRAESDASMTAERGRRSRSYSLGVVMALAIAAMAALAYWDAQREAASALLDFADEQSTLSMGVAAAVSTELAALGTESATVAPTALLSSARAMEDSGRHLFLIPPDQPGLAGADGRSVRSATIEDAFRRGARSVRLSREEAAAFGLPRRTAIAGIATAVGPLGRWGVVVLTTALRERDRELRTERRLVLGVLVAAILVLSLGGISLRKQRKELELERRVAVAELERQRDQQLLQIDKLATVGALATGIAHEVSTPLGVILGRADQLLSKVKDDENARRAVESILDQGNHINGVVRGFLQFARGQASPFERVNAETLARDAAELVEHRYAKAGVRLDVAAHGVPVVQCEPKLFQQVLINLLLNACDACEPGGAVRLSVEENGDRVAFTVEDDGAGITEEAAARAIEPFFTTKPAGRGTGLGLAIANEIVHHHGGELRIAPRSERGGASARGTAAIAELPGATDGRGNA